MYLCPSTMCLDFSNLKESVKELEQAGTDIFHNDIMDGNFVPNFALGLNDIKAIRKLTDKLIDAHLMISNPKEKVDWFINAGVDIIYIHVESDPEPLSTLKYIKEKNCKCGIAINPETSIDKVENLLEYCDYVLAMSVHPGFAGQKFVGEVKPKIEQLCKLKEKYKFNLIMDGACSPEIIHDFSNIGVDGFVLGTSALFGKNDSYEAIFNRIRKEGN